MHMSFFNLFILCYNRLLLQQYQEVHSGNTEGAVYVVELLSQPFLSSGALVNKAEIQGTHLSAGPPVSGAVWAARLSSSSFLHRFRLDDDKTY